MQFSKLAFAAMMANPAFAQSVKQLFNFTSTYIDIENSALRPNGQILLSTFSNASLYSLDPSSASPQAELLAQLPGITALCGIATIGTDKFAVVGGIRGSYMYTNETVFTIDFSSNATVPTIQVAAKISNATMLNGMASLPAYPHIVMAGNSRQGAVYRIDTETGLSSIAFSDDALAAPANVTVPIGINGLKIFNGWLYFTNTARNTYGRVLISDEGYQTGDVEVLAELDASLGDWDDFIMDGDGVAYAAQPENVVERILKTGDHAAFVNSSIVIAPTSLTLTKDGKTLYVTTRGGAVDGFTYSGQVLEITL